MTDEQDWTPAFAGQRPPFAPGNEHAVAPGNDTAVQHGAYSQRKVGDVAAEVLDEWRAGDDWPPQLDAARFGNAVRAAAWAEATCRLLRSYIAERESITDLLVEGTTAETSTTEVVSDKKTWTRSAGKRVHSAVALLERWEATAARRRAELGLTPASETKLSRNVAMAHAARQMQIEALRAAGRDTVAGRERMRALPPLDEQAGGDAG